VGGDGNCFRLFASLLLSFEDDLPVLTATVANVEKIAGGESGGG